MSIQFAFGGSGSERANRSEPERRGRYAGIFVLALARRTLQMFIVAFLVLIITFALIHLIPGDPAMMILGKMATPDALEALRAKLHLDLPLIEQFWTLLRGIAVGDLGTSLVSETQSVSSIVFPAFLNSLSIVGLTVVISLVLGLSIGILAGIRRGDWLDNLIRAVMVLLLATPPFMFGFLLLLLALNTGIAPAGGWGTSPADSLQYLWLPSLALSASLTPVIGRSMRQSVRETLGQDFTESAIARGLPTRTLILRHVLPNSLLPIIGLLGYTISGLIGGAAIVEVVFNIPGVGSAMVAAVGSRDFPVVQGIALVSAIAVIIFNGLSDAAFWLIDPRTRKAS